MTSVISGRVVDAAGKPIAMARVGFEEGPVALPDIAALTDREGTFALSAPVPGRYKVRATADGFGSAGVEVVAGERATPLEIRLSRG